MQGRRRRWPATVGVGLRVLVGCALVAIRAPASGVPAAASSEAVAREVQVDQVAPRSEQAPTLSASARRVYERARSQLLQVRTLMASQDSQTSVGSGFLVSDDGHVISNYHVISDFALDPSRFRLRFATTDGQQGPLELLDVDVRRDLALLRVPASHLQGRGALRFRPREQPLAKGERMYSMGNPLDVAFAVVEGTYNGHVQRSFDPLIYYAGSLNPGMSGGPAVDEDGDVVGVNVSSMMFAQQMSFLIPGEFAADLLERSRQAKPQTTPAWTRVRDQLLHYQEDLTRQFIAQPWRAASHREYRFPAPEETYMRCWGQGSSSEDRGVQTQRTQCRMEYPLFVDDTLQTGYLQVAHDAYNGDAQGRFRFASAFSTGFHDAGLERPEPGRTAAYCQESFVQREGPPLRAVVCLRAYTRLEGLHDLSVLVATVDESTVGVQGRFDAKGVSFDNAMRLADHYLRGIGWATLR